MDSAVNKDRVEGTLLGGAVGDSFGALYEFSHGPTIPFPALLTGPGLDLGAGGPHHITKGQITDDTMMATCLWRSLNERDSLDTQDIAERYLEWRGHTFDIGGQTSGALEQFRQGEKPTFSGYWGWAKGGRNAAGNGSLMRTWAIPAYQARQKRVVERSILDSAITHFDPKCLIACAAYNSAISHAISSENASAWSMHKAAVSGVYEARDWLLDSLWFPQYLEREEIERAARDIYDDLQYAALDDPYLYGERGDNVGIRQSSGYVRTALRCAFWHLLHAPDYRSAIVSVVNAGGDSDTNGAIAGALYGSLVGRAGIPAEWSDAVINCQTRHGGALDTLYHPRVFVGLPDPVVTV